MRSSEKSARPTSCESPLKFGANSTAGKKRSQTELFAPLGIRILLANSCTRWRRFFKGLSQDGSPTDFYENLCASLFKGTQAWDNFKFFFDLKSNPYMPFVNFRKKSLLFLRFSPEFRSSNISAVTEHARNQIFFERYPKKIFLLNLHFGPIR